jgi:hypothetical protein
MLDPGHVRRTGTIWALAFLALAGGAAAAHALLAIGFAVSGERMARRLRLTAFEAVSTFRAGLL